MVFSSSTFLMAFLPLTLLLYYGCSSTTGSAWR